MTPQQEATQIIRQYQELLPDHLGALEYPIARQCAVLAVTKILEANPHAYEIGAIPSFSTQKYWQAVLDNLKTI